MAHTAPAKHSRVPPKALTRRTSLLLSTVSAAQPAVPQWVYAQQPPQDPPTLLVDAAAATAAPQHEHYPTIGAALAAAPPGAIIAVAAGTYRERIVPSREVTIRPHQPGQVVEVVWETQEPYQSVLELRCRSGDGASSAGSCTDGASSSSPLVRVRGLVLRHCSKSVANNYAVFVQGGRLELQGCDIRSDSGCGVGAEGAELDMQDCTVQGCERHGLALFGSLDGDTPGDVRVRGCTLSRNKQHGVLVRAGAAPRLSDNSISANGGFGLLLKDCGGSYRGNKVSTNRAGSVGLDSATLEINPSDLEADNQLDTRVQLLP